MKGLLLFMMMACFATANAQINIGSGKIPSLNRAGRLSQDDIDELKGTTTLFTLQYRDYDVLRSYQKAIEKVWTITKFKIIKPDEIGDYMDKPGYSFFSFGGYEVTERNTTTGAGSTNVHLSYDLWMPRINKGKVRGTDYYSRIDLYPNPGVNQQVGTNFWGHFSDKMITYLYNEAVLYNWSPGMLQGYFKTVNDALLDDDTKGPFTYMADDDALARLKRDTLYVPDYVNITYSPFIGRDWAPKEEPDEEDVSGRYPYPIKYVSTSQLDDLIANHNGPVYYLVFVRSSTDKFVSVYESDKGEIYSRYKAMSYNFKNKDLGKLAKAIR